MVRKKKPRKFQVAWFCNGCTKAGEWHGDTVSVLSVLQEHEERSPKCLNYIYVTYKEIK